MYSLAFEISLCTNIVDIKLIIILYVILPDMVMHTYVCMYSVVICRYAYCDMT